MADSPFIATSDLATFTVKAGGVDMDDRYEILSIFVERALNRIPAARITVRDGSAANESFTASASTDFAPGVKVQVLLGYHADNTAVFSGVIVKTAVQQSRGGHSTLTITCRDEAVAMTIGRRSACYVSTPSEAMTDSKAMTKVLSQYSTLTAAVASTSGTLEEITQFATTDWDFLLSRADANGMVVKVLDSTVSVLVPKFSGTPKLSVTYGFDIFDVSLEEDVRTQFSSVACSSWDPATQALLSSTESISDDNALGSDTSTTLAKITGSKSFALNTTTPVAVALLKTWADAQLLKCELAKIRGTIRFQGSSVIEPADLLSVAGLGERFDGNAFVSAVMHEFRDGEWTTEVSVGLDPAWFAARPDVSVPPAYALLPGVHGIQIGTVKQIQDDPGKQFRVLVNVPTVDNTGNGIWARLARPYATKSAGWFFYPEVGDEVALAFLDGDPRFPIIVGSLHSSSRPPPLPIEVTNKQKGIITNKQLKVLFDEDKLVITLVTPAGNTVVISDDTKSITLTDQNKNSVKLGTDGITLTSASDILIKAAQNITLQAQAGKITATAKQAVSVSGLSVSLSASTDFSATGNGSAKLTSTGQTQIKGSMVMIN